MIRSFAHKRTAAVFRGEMPKRFPPDLALVARRKLRMLDAAAQLADLRAPPANRLEALVADRAGQHSIRINDQWRASASSGAKAMRRPSRSSITIESD